MTAGSINSNKKRISPSPIEKPTRNTIDPAANSITWGLDNITQKLADHPLPSTIAPKWGNGGKGVWRAPQKDKAQI